MSEKQKDVFISYASEDRDTVARPLAELLTAFGVSVWFDQFDLKIGDSLRRKIDEGLAGCSFGIVILSPYFFDKGWPNRELDGLTQREADSGKVILPVWYGINEQQVRHFSPPLADRVAGRWEDGIGIVVIKLLEVIKPSAMEDLLSRPIFKLEKITSGKEALDICIGCHFSYSFNDDSDNETEIELVGGFIQSLSDWSDIWNDIEATCRLRASHDIDAMIRELSDAGWTVYGCKMQGKRKFNNVENQWIWNSIAVLRGDNRNIVFMDDRFIVIE